MNSYHFKALLTEHGWRENVTVSVDTAGNIIAVSQEAIPDSIRFNGYAVPGFQNAHSHAFQYAMAGLAERHAAHTDDFWSWRELMYQVALSISPDQMKDIAAMLYSEMLRHGFTNVAEFHYLHHDPAGRPYTQLAAMGEALVEAARITGIKITLIPSFYQLGGFGQPPTPRQRRFISRTFDDYVKLFSASVEVCRNYAGANIGVSVHSLRAVDHRAVLATVRELPSELPFHIHAAEQLQEVLDSVQHLGCRPLEWLLDNVALNERFHLIHCTHLTEAETDRLARSGAHVILCPSTEGNLGDGIFPLRRFQSGGGQWSIGTDSQIGLDPLEELRLLDYGQRLITHRRDTFISDQTTDSGTCAIARSIQAGRRAMNNPTTEFFKVGAAFDACVFNAATPLLENVSLENLGSSLVYPNHAGSVLGVFVNGRLIRPEHDHAHLKETFLQCVRAGMTVNVDPSVVWIRGSREWIERMGE